MKFPGCTPFFIQMISISTCIFLIIYVIISFISFNIARLAINLYIFTFSLVTFVADLKAFNFFGYLKFIYTPTGRGLMFLLMGFVMMGKGIFDLVSGIVVCVIGIVYFAAAMMFGGVPKPIMQRNVEDMPLNTQLRFVNLDGEVHQQQAATNPAPPRV